MKIVNQQPTITVITVVYNGEQYIEETIKSVISQTYGYIEYIVIDGNSTDRTLEFIRRYEANISKWISEPDKGIYDAMNKGIDLATGKWIIFMNAGDRFYTTKVIEDIFSDSSKIEGDLIYGHCNIVYATGFSRIKKAEELSDLWKGMVCSHQSIFSSSELMKQYKFNCYNRIGADFEFIYEMYKKRAHFKMEDRVIASCNAGGLSDTERMKSITSHWQVVKEYKSSTYVDIYYIMLLIDTFLRQTVKKILRAKIIAFILRHK